MRNTILLTLLFLGTAAADTLEWNTVDGGWHVPGYWNALRLPLATDRVNIDNAGTSVVSSAGAVADDLYLGSAVNKKGTLQVTGGDLTMTDDVFVGNSRGLGRYEQTGGTFSAMGASGDIIVGRATGGTGVCEVAGGTLATKNMEVGWSGNGTLRVSAPAVLRVGEGSTGALTVGFATGGMGSFEMDGGHAYLWGLYVGRDGGVGSVDLSGSAAFVSSGNTRIGSYAGSSATLTIRDQAEMRIFNQTPYIGYGGTGAAYILGGCLMTSNTATRVFTIGSTGGSGTLFLGDENTTGVISNRLSYFGTYTWRDGSMTVRGDASSRGTLRGWGNVALRLKLVNNGRVIADGYGDADRTLNLSWFGADPGGGVFNDIENTTSNGWFAVGEGRLLLPAVAVAANAGTVSYNWGEDTTDTAIDLVNSVQLSFENAVAFALSGALLAEDRTEVPEGLPALCGVWQFSGGTFAAAALTFRYDEADAAARNVQESDLKVWQYVGGRWTDVTSGRDTTAHTLTTVPVTELGLFAVSTEAPNRATVVIIQ